MKSPKSVLVVGGGTAGLIAAIILKKGLSNLKVDVVHSKNIGIVGVGEGSTEHFRNFMNFAGINQHQIIKECDATYKSGIMFTNWGPKNYLHSVGEPFNNKMGLYPHVYARQIGNNIDYVNSGLLWNNKLEQFWLNNKENPPFNQFHFNTHKLNDFMIKHAKKTGIGIYEDDIQDVMLNQDGEIDKLKGNNMEYDYDFYIDATGFKRLLMDKLGGKWQSFGDVLKMKAAITFQTEDTSEYNLWTLAHAMDAGWLFRIPVWGRHGNGYIYDSDYIDKDQAKAEVEKLYGKEINIGKEFKFDPGHIDRAWIKNCVAIGLSGSFVEPLEASSIGTSIQQAFILLYKIINYDEKVIDTYNHSFVKIMENIRDFLVLHYITPRQDTPFWKDLQNAPLPDSLGKKLEIWRNKLPNPENFNDQTDYCLFWHDNFTVVMEGLNLFDRKAILNEYMMQNQDIKDDADRVIKEIAQKDETMETMGHKKMISIIRDHLELRDS